MLIAFSPYVNKRGRGPCAAPADDPKAIDALVREFPDLGEGYLEASLKMVNQ